MSAPRILVRLRGLNDREKALNLPNCVIPNGPTSLVFTPPEGATGLGASEWQFDRVFAESASQAEVFEEVKPLIKATLEVRTCYLGDRVALIGLSQRRRRRSAELLICSESKLER